MPVAWDPVAERAGSGWRWFPPSLPPHLPLFLLSDFQPKVQSRLVRGSGTCAGYVEVRQGRQWEALCHSNPAKASSRWEEVCGEQQCGSFSSYQVRDAGDKTSRGLVCHQEKLSQCYQLQETSRCRRVFVTCESATAHRRRRQFWVFPVRTGQRAGQGAPGPQKRMERWQMGGGKQEHSDSSECEPQREDCP